MDYYQTSFEDWWNHIGPVDYLCILLASLFLGWLLLRGSSQY